MINLGPLYSDYYADALGNIHSFKKSKGLILKQNVHKSGYHSVCLSMNGMVKRIMVHRLVAYAFLGLSLEDSDTQVNHKNGNKGDNRKDNLELTDNSGNHLHAFNELNRKPTWLGRFGAKHCCARKYLVTFPDGSKTEITGLNEFCRTHGLRQSNMSNVIAGRSSHHRGYKIERITS